MKKGKFDKRTNCLIYHNQYFEIDVFPFSSDLAIMELEFNDENQEIVFPYFIDVIKEVKDNLNYRNIELVKKRILKMFC